MSFIYQNKSNYLNRDDEALVQEIQPMRREAPDGLHQSRHAPLLRNVPEGYVRISNSTNA